MTNFVRIFYYFLLGAGGGLTGWYLNSLVFYGSKSPLPVVSLIASGAIIGSFIGFGIGFYDGLTSRSLVRMMYFGFAGFMLGAFAGAVALPLTQSAYSLLLQGNSTGQPSATSRFFVGILCWAFFGGIIGTIEGFHKGTQKYKGFLGGLIGGTIGGILYEINRSLMNERSDLISQRFQAGALAIMGGAIGTAVALVAILLKKASIEVMSGTLTGRIYDVTKYVDPRLGSIRPGILGSDRSKADIYLPQNEKILLRHALLNYSNGAPTLTASSEAQKLQAVIKVNGRAIVTSPLSDLDRIEVGMTSLVYHQNKK